MTIKPPTQVFEFSAKVPNGDRIDAQFADHAAAIASLTQALADIRRSDGVLNNHAITPDTLHPDLVDRLIQAIRKEFSADLIRLQSAVVQAVQARDDAIMARSIAETAAQRAIRSEDIVTGGASNAVKELKDIANEAHQDRTIAVQALTDATNQQNAVMVSANSAENWALASNHWAEYMDGTIPADTVAWMEITGDHWSARWWANYVARMAAGKILIVGNATRYLYFATFGQTVFTGLDYYSQSLVLDWTTHRVEVFANGSLLTPVFDYSTAVANRVTLLTPLAAGDSVEILVTKPLPTQPGQTGYRKRLDTSGWVFDGTSFTFPLIDIATGSPIGFAVDREQDVTISLNGVILAPKRDYTLSFEQIMFTTAPEPDAQVFGHCIADSLV